MSDQSTSNSDPGHVPDSQPLIADFAERNRALRDRLLGIVNDEAIAIKELDERMRLLEATLRKKAATRVALEVAAERSARICEIEAEVASRRRELEDWLGAMRKGFDEAQAGERARLDEQRKKVESELAQCAELRAALDEREAKVAEQEQEHETDRKLKKVREDAFVKSARAEVAEEVELLRIERDEQRKLRETVAKELDRFQSESAEMKATLKVLEGRSLRDVIGNETQLRKENQQLLNELASRPLAPPSLEEVQRLIHRCEQLASENTQLSLQNQKAQGLNVQLETWRDFSEQLKKNIESLRGELDKTSKNYVALQAEMRRRDNASEDRDARLATILEPIDSFAAKRFPAAAPDPDEPEDAWLQEAAWLQGVSEAIRGCGFHFSNRTLRAFHTSLKVAEWAPLTILAGVSGSGKSELPRLYARAGGLRFLLAPVQPNWDSPHDLFGFFNYSENRFNATDVLRAMAQAARPPDEHGFSDGMLLILLDEMNLARVELYFSDLLSKLEARRGSNPEQRESIPIDEQSESIPIDIGSGLARFPLPLSRNVLFAGTMNTDESTHALSDKAIDRGNMLVFQRPDQLFSRDRASLPKMASALTYKRWRRWLRSPEDIPPKKRADYRVAVETINRALSKVQHAIGHRVWQAIEHYMANYSPGVTQVQESDEERLDRGLREAFADQVVQKILPKLADVELTEDALQDCFDPIRDVLEGCFRQPDGSTDKYSVALLKGFDAALASRSGTFVWRGVDTGGDPDGG